MVVILAMSDSADMCISAGEEGTMAFRTLRDSAVPMPRRILQCFPAFLPPLAATLPTRLIKGVLQSLIPFPAQYAGNLSQASLTELSH